MGLQPIGFHNLHEIIFLMVNFNLITISDHFADAIGKLKSIWYFTGSLAAIKHWRAVICKILYMNDIRN